MRSLLLVLALAGCEQSYILDGTVTVTPDVAPTGAANVIVIVDGRTEAIDWTASDAGQSASAEPQAFAPGRLGYTYRYEQFGASPHALYVAAFIDLNGNHRLDPGEPFGDYAGNPIIDAPWGSTADPTTANIAIDQR